MEFQTEFSSAAGKSFSPNFDYLTLINANRKSTDEFELFFFFTWHNLANERENQAKTKQYAHRKETEVKNVQMCLCLLKLSSENISSLNVNRKQYLPAIVCVGMHEF